MYIFMRSCVHSPGPSVIVCPFYIVPFSVVSLGSTLSLSVQYSYFIMIRVYFKDLQRRAIRATTVQNRLPCAN